MIQMVCGACRVGNELKRAGDGPFTLSPEEEKRLVTLGAAEYVDAPQENAKSTKPQKVKAKDAPPELGAEDPVA